VSLWNGLWPDVHDFPLLHLFMKKIEKRDEDKRDVPPVEISADQAD
jgi:hypothetical protein